MNEKIIALKAKAKQIWESGKNLEFGSTEFEANQLEYFAAKQAIKAAEAAEAAAAAEAAKAEARSKRLAFLTDAISFAIANHMVASDKKASDEQKQTASEAAAKAYEACANELLSKFVKPAAAAGTKAASGRANGNGEILTHHLDNVANGKTDAESRTILEAMGFPRSTVWHAVNNYNKAK